MMRKIGLTCIATILMAVFICGCGGAKGDVSDGSSSSKAGSSSVSDTKSTVSSKTTSVIVHDDTEYSLDGNTFKHDFSRSHVITTLTMPEGFNLYSISSTGAVFRDNNHNEIIMLDTSQSGSSKDTLAKDSLKSSIEDYKKDEEHSVITDSPVEETINGHSFTYIIYEENDDENNTNIKLRSYYDDRQYSCFNIKATFNQNDITSDKLAEVITSMVSSIEKENES